MINIEKLREEYDDANQSIIAGLEGANNSCNQKISEAARLQNIAQHSDILIEKINLDFEKKTKLSKIDISFLLLAVAIQCVRQYLLPNDALKITAKDGDKLMQDTVGKTIGFIKPEWNEVLFQSVPYDAVQIGAHVSNTGISGATHRYKTLGHDPILGWVFGTANIMTNSLTKSDFETFQVKDMKIIRHYPLGCMGMLKKAVEYSSDVKLLAASVARQAIHFGSDVFTKQGLPIPLIATVNNDLAKDMLSKWHIDVWSIAKAAGMAAFINTLIAYIHKLFYDESKDGSPELYEVRTRKILSYSNMIASASNIIIVAIGTAAGIASGNPGLIKKSVSKLDIGGILVTIYRIINDRKFIYEIKKEFLEHEWENIVDNYNY